MDIILIECVASLMQEVSVDEVIGDSADSERNPFDEERKGLLLEYVSTSVKQILYVEEKRVPDMRHLRIFVRGHTQVAQ